MLCCSFPDPPGLCIRSWQDNLLVSLVGCSLCGSVGGALGRFGANLSVSAGERRAQRVVTKCECLSQLSEATACFRCSLSPDLSWTAECSIFRETPLWSGQ